MNAGVEIKIVYWDTDMMELEIICSNLRFSGRTKLYVSNDELSEMARDLTGFPTSLSDTREYKLGTFDPDVAGGGARFRFHRVDAAGHCRLLVVLRSDPRAVNEESPESVTLNIPVEVEAIDRFVRQVESLPLEVGSHVEINMAT